MSDEAPSTAPNSPSSLKGGGLPPSVRSNSANSAKSSSPTNSNSSSAAPPRAPLPSTPARDPTSLMAKRMQNLQLHHPMHLSPLPSSSALLTAGSPLRTMAITPSRGPTSHHHHHRPFDLTPVMKNTSTMEETAAVIDIGHHHTPPVPPHMPPRAGPVHGNLNGDLDTLELDFDLDKLVDTVGGTTSTNLNPTTTAAGGGSRNVHVVSPDGAGDGLLLGEHLLALPNDLCKTSLFSATAGGNGAAGGPNQHPLPSLAKRGSLPVTVAQRRGSTGMNWQHFAPPSSNHAAVEADRSIQITGTPKAPIRAPELAFFPEEMMEDNNPSMPFPLGQGKSNTFTSRKQYEKQMQSSQEQQGSPNNTTAGLKPYQPSRQDPGLVDIPPEELNRIFTPRRNGTNSRPTTDSTILEADRTFSSTGPTTASSEDADEFPSNTTDTATTAVQQQHQHMLFAPIPLEERQWSIPSIRMANQLGGGGGGGESVTSCTTYTDEDDESCLYYRDVADDASLSSIGSYTNNIGNVVTLGGGQDIHDTPFVVAVTPQKQQPSSFDSNEAHPPCDWLRQDPGQYHPPTLVNANANFAQAFAPRGEDATFQNEVAAPAATCRGDDTEDDIMILPPTTQSRYHQRRRRQKRKEQRDRQALEWLRTVKAGKDEVAEAASSKFLTGRNTATLEDTTHHRPFKRLSAAAAVDTTAMFAFPTTTTTQPHPDSRTFMEEEDTENLKMLATR